MPRKNGLGSVLDNVRGTAGKMVESVKDAISPADANGSHEAQDRADGARAGVDAIQLLTEDHRKVKALFAEADALSDTAAAARAKLFKQIDAELTLHTRVEEEIFYPAFKAKTKRNTDERDEVLEAYEEHAGAKDLIRKLEGLEPRDETYKAKVQVLREMVEHHIREEESVLFHQARALLGEDELRELGRRIEAAKRSAGTRAAAKKSAPRARRSTSASTRARTSGKKRATR
jgi:hemerythrin superfamily protein